MPIASTATTAARGERQFSYLLLGLLVAGLTLALWSLRQQLPLLERFEQLSLDAQLQWRGQLQPAAQPEIVIIQVDDASLQRLGGFAPDRRSLAQAIERLDSAQARVIALDLLLFDASSRDPEGDARLAQAQKKAGNVLIPYALLNENAGHRPTEPSRSTLDSCYQQTRGETATALLPMQAQGILQALPIFADAAAGVGHVSVHRAPDGAPRYDLPALPFAGESYPALAVRIAAQARNIDWQSVSVHYGQSIELGGQSLPLDTRSRLWVNYYGPAGRFPAYSFVDLLDGRIEPGRLAGRIVLIGSTAIGAGDFFPTPFDTGLPGVERLATVVDNILSERSLRRPYWASPVELGSLILLPLWACWLIGRWPLRRALLLITLGTGGLLLGLQQLFVQTQIFLAPAFPLLALLLATLSALVIRGSVEQAKRKAALRALQASEERYALALQGANDGMWDWDIVNQQIFFSERWLTLMGLDTQAPARMTAWTAALDDSGHRAFESALEEHLQGRSFQLHHVLHFKQGGVERWLLARGVATRDVQGRPIRMAGSLTDISESQNLQQQLTHDALHDRLTGLPNRAAFLERLDWACTVAYSSTALRLGLLLVDIDDFRQLNEREGSAQGDAILIELAQRLSRLGWPNYGLARLNADRFALWTNCSLGNETGGIAELGAQVQASLAQPFELGHAAHALSFSLGWSHSEQGLPSAAELLAAAEMALAQGKARHRGQLHGYDPAELQIENKRRWLKENLDQAIATEQFELHYQPLVQLGSRRLLGFEALIRWPHPEKGMVMPGDFIPYAEESGQIIAMSQWILRSAARQLVAWDKLGFTGEIAVNLSGRHFSEGNLLADARSVLEILGPINPRRLKLEVTESMAMSNPQVTASALQELSAFGFKISIDDFGTGYSSLAYLHRFPFDTLKIDRSFVIRLSAGREAVEIVRTIVGLAKALDKQTLAEGVEDEAQAGLLQQLGVEVGQGWLFAKALHTEQAERFLLEDLAGNR